jgi:hypothetical protein
MLHLGKKVGCCLLFAKIVETKLPEMLKLSFRNKGKRFCETFLPTKKRIRKLLFFVAKKNRELQLKLAKSPACRTMF